MRRLFRDCLILIVAIGLSSCHSSSSPAPSTPAPPQGNLLGLDARPANAACIAPPRQPADVTVALQREFANLSFSQPLGMLQAPGDSSRWFVLEKTGRVRVFANDPDVTAFAADFIDINSVTSLNTNSEGGLLGMAFHPDYQNNGEVFVSWTEVGSPMTSVIERFVVSAGGLTLDAGSGTAILRLEQDFENHNGGQIVFGPDGYLYAGFGDGGSGGDPLSRAQETRNLLGAMLRIDPDGAVPYGIPADNPFFGNATCPANPDLLGSNCPELFAWGLRNPWRFSFDTATGDLWLGDVGQGTREEIDLVERGGNYGWDCREGNLAHGAPAPSCSTATGLIDPLHDYPRTEGTSVTGGFVYRGSAIPELVGSYLFADYGSGRLWRLVADGQGGWTDDLLLDTGLNIASFGQANDGELYVVNIGGSLHRIVQAGIGAPASPVPDRLSGTGCMLATDASEPGPGLIPYSVAASFWSDGASKERWLAIPDGATIDVTADGDFSLPPGSVVVKQFRLGQQLIETRLLMHHPDGTWAGYTYEWDEALGDGVLVQGGKLVDLGSQDWLLPSSAQCLVCHTSAAGRTLGLETLQLNNELRYPATGRTANQLATLAGVRVLASAIANPDALPSLVDPFDSTESLDDRARSYLHTNCAQCHRPGGPTPSDLDLRYRTGLNQTNACDRMPQVGDLGLGAGARIVAPGSSALSVLVERMSRRDANGMPPLASHLVDSAGVGLVGDWIDSLGSCL
jgi:uncharacterized repeat protein (TIGR03806 family)